MGVQAIALALISRLRWRCYPDESGRCQMVSGCTEHSLLESGGVDAAEYVINDRRYCWSQAKLVDTNKSNIILSIILSIQTSKRGIIVHESIIHITFQNVS